MSIVKIKDPEVIGPLDKKSIQKIVRQHQGELHGCYEKELNKNMELNGSVVAVWIISPQGYVNKSILKESSIKNKNVEDCVVNSIKFWKFPQPKDGVVQVTYTFEFEPKSN